jgi:hypothetical protein
MVAPWLLRVVVERVPRLARALRSTLARGCSRLFYNFFLKKKECSCFFSWKALLNSQTHGIDASHGLLLLLLLLLRVREMGFDGRWPGLLGIGGGMVLGPLLVALGCDPLATAATSAFAVLVTATAGLAQVRWGGLGGARHGHGGLGPGEVGGFGVLVTATAGLAQVE